MICVICCCNFLHSIAITNDHISGHRKITYTPSYVLVRKKEEKNIQNIYIVVQSLSFFDFFFFFLSASFDEPEEAPFSFCFVLSASFSLTISGIFVVSAAAGAATTSSSMNLGVAASTLVGPEDLQRPTRQISTRQLLASRNGYLLSRGIEDDLECSFKIGNDILDVLDSNGDSDEVSGDTRRELFGLAELRMSCGRGVDDEGLGIT